jgi:hypothetical protein
MTGLVLQHGDWGPPGLLADWAAAHAEPATRAAFDLFDAFWHRTRT